MSGRDDMRPRRGQQQLQQQQQQHLLPPVVYPHPPPSPAPYSYPALHPHNPPQGYQQPPLSRASTPFPDPLQRQDGILLRQQSYSQHPYAASSTAAFQIPAMPLYFQQVPAVASEPPRHPHQQQQQPLPSYQAYHEGFVASTSSANIPNRLDSERHQMQYSLYQQGLQQGQQPWTGPQQPAASHQYHQPIQMYYRGQPHAAPPVVSISSPTQLPAASTFIAPTNAPSRSSDLIARCRSPSLQAVVARNIPYVRRTRAQRRTSGTTVSQHEDGPAPTAPSSAPIWQNRGASQPSGSLQGLSFGFSSSTSRPDAGHPRPSSPPPFSSRSGRSSLPPMPPGGSSFPCEHTLPPHAPVGMHRPQASDFVDQDVDMSTLYAGECPIEVTLNIDIPKTSSPAAAGDSSATVLSVNPSWHCVFVETVQQQRTRTSIRVQFCPSPVSPTLNTHRDKILKLKTLQVIGYASQQVELTLRISGESLLRKGGLLVHLDPSAIGFNDVSYGFTLSFSSFAAERLCMGNAGRPDEPLPLGRQRNSAYCRRNLKELYYDTFSKDVAITLQPSGELVYAHSVVLENYAHFRALLERSSREPAYNTNGHAGTDADADVGVGTSASAGVSHHEQRGGGDVDHPVDEEGYAQPLYSQPVQPSQHPPQQQPQRGPFRGRQDDGSLLPLNRSKARMEILNASPSVFRAILHYMYMGHIPTTVKQLISSHPPPRPSTATATSNNEEFASSSSSAPPPVEPQGSVPPNQRSAVTPGPGEGSNRDAEPGSTSTSTPAGPSTQPSTAPATSCAETVFSWRELYETASRFQLAGLMHLAKLVLISRLDVDLGIQELFEWAYHHWTLVPSYVSFLIEHMEPTLPRNERQEPEGSRGRAPGLGLGQGLGLGLNTTDGSASKSVFSQYRNQCPRFDEIMALFFQMLNERNNAGTLI
ncbi:MAG: hypothetical protein J3Q66DRAFT_445440 [Benniella sp.]|nr:MAG: hypothetical protein J3Q66DRAFT_445440 [Benniella sp.]